MYLVKIQKMQGNFVEKTCPKIINSPQLADEQFRQMFSEFYIAKDLNHPNLNPYRYFMKKYDPQDKTHEMHIIQDYQEGGDLNDFLNISMNKQSLPLDLLKDFAGQLISAICYLHDRDILHGDLKPANILMSAD